MATANLPTNLVILCILQLIFTHTSSTIHQRRHSSHDPSRLIGHSQPRFSAKTAIANEIDSVINSLFDDYNDEAYQNNLLHNLQDIYYYYDGVKPPKIEPKTKISLNHLQHHKYTANALREFENVYAQYDMAKPYGVLNQGTKQPNQCKWVKQDLGNDEFNNFPSSKNEQYQVDCGFKLGGSDSKKKVLKKDTIIWSIQKKFDPVTDATFFHSTPNIRKNAKMTDDEFFIPYKVKQPLNILYYQNYHTDTITSPPDYITDKTQAKYSDAVGYVTCSYCYIFIEQAHINKLEANPPETASNKYNKDSIPKLRAFCHYIYTKAKAKIDAEIKDVLNKIYKWYRFEIAGATDDATFLTMDQKTAIVKQFNPPKAVLAPESAGMIPKQWQAVIDVINGRNDANMREKMQLIFTSVFMSCQWLWKAMFSYYFNTHSELASHYKDASSLGSKWVGIYESIFTDANDLNKRISQIEKLTGFEFHDLYTQYDKNSVLTTTTKGFPNLCVNGRPMKIGPVRLSRVIKYPKIRDDKKDNARYIKKKDIYPPLSSREIERIREVHKIADAVVWNENTPIPWQTGYWWSNPNAQSLWKTIPDEFGLLSIAGPSGSGNVLMDIALSFGADTTYFLAANIIYMGIPPDHSLYEIIFALDKNWYPGLDDYYVEKDPYCWFLQKLNAKLSS